MSRPAPSAKSDSRKRHIESDSEASESEEEVEEVRKPVVPVGGLVHKRARKSEAEKLAESSGPAPSEDSEGEAEARPRARSAKTTSGLATRDKRTARQRGGPKPAPERPNYQPVKDKNNRKLWKGSRASLGWFPNVSAAMASVNDGTCKIAKGGCDGTADAVDHIKDFATEQTGLETEIICDGDHHWNAILLDEAKLLYNGGFDPATPIIGDVALMTELGKTFKWSCTHCNSSKGGTKGLDGGYAGWLKACPGEDCDI